MPYRITSGAAIIEVDSEAELRNVLVLLGVSVAPQGRLALDAVLVPISNADRMRTVYRRLKGNQRRIFDTLAGADWVQDQTLRNVLGMDSNLKLAGVWAGFVKQLKRYDLAAEQVFMKETRNGSGPDAGYWYKLTDECRAAINK